MRKERIPNAAEVPCYLRWVSSDLYGRTIYFLQKGSFSKSAARPQGLPTETISVSNSETDFGYGLLDIPKPVRKSGVAFMIVIVLMFFFAQ